MLGFQKNIGFDTLFKCKVDHLSKYIKKVKNTQILLLKSFQLWLFISKKISLYQSLMKSNSY